MYITSKMSKLLTFLLCALCSYYVSGAPQLGKSSKVKLQVLYESLCPGCMQDMTEIIPPVYHQLSKYIDLHLYPYGNAHTRDEMGKQVVECQHGPLECYGNTIHVCAIDILKDVSVYLDYIACMMERQTDDQMATQCAKQMKIDVAPILKCAKSDRGLQLLIETGKESRKIKYDYVPYTVLNDQEMDYRKDLKTEICKLLNPAPPACSSL